MVELTKLIVRIRGNLSKLERKIIVALVTTDVHARDIIDELYENKARASGEREESLDFLMLKRLYFA